MIQSKAAETADLDSFAASKGLVDRMEDFLDRNLGILGRQGGEAAGEGRNEVRAGHNRVQEVVIEFGFALDRLYVFPAYQPLATKRKTSIRELPSLCG